MSLKNRLKSTPRNNTPNEYTNPMVFRSRSIDSMSANEQNESHSGGEGSQIDEKPPGSATFSKTFNLFRKRLSRKNDRTRKTSNQNDNAAKSGGDDNGAKSGGDDSAAKSGGDDSEGGSSAGEDSVPLTFTATPTSHPDLPAIETSTAVPLGVHRSLPAEKTPAIITSPPPPPPINSNEKNDSNASNYENSNLSKTWSPSTFTGEQLHGKCSIEYTEHMKDKSHKRKAHVIDLRKDDNQQQQQQQISPNNQTSSSKNSISTSLPSYHSYNLILFNTKGVLTYYFL